MADLLYEKSGHVAKLTLNRPERMNAISMEMLGRLGEALVDADDDAEIRVILITGSGRGFCSGLDLKDAAAGTGIGGAGVLSPDGGASHLSTREIPTVTLHRIDTPVLCAINGAAAGYGVDLALGCDIRLIGDRAKLLPGFAKRGIVPDCWYGARSGIDGAFVDVDIEIEGLDPQLAGQVAESMRAVFGVAQVLVSDKRIALHA